MKLAEFNKASELLVEYRHIMKLLSKVTLNKAPVLSVQIYQGVDPASGRSDYDTVWKGSSAVIQTAIVTALETQARTLLTSLKKLGLEVDCSWSEMAER